MHLNSLFELTIAHALPICRSSCLFHLARNLPCCNSVYGSRDAQPPKPLYMAVSSPMCLLKQTTRIESPKLQMKTSTLSFLCSTECCQSEETPSSPDQGQQKKVAAPTCRRLTRMGSANPAWKVRRSPSSIPESNRETKKPTS